MRDRQGAETFFGNFLPVPIFGTPWGALFHPLFKPHISSNEMGLTNFQAMGTQMAHQ